MCHVGAHAAFQCGPVVRKLQRIIITAKICFSALKLQTYPTVAVEGKVGENMC